MIKTNNEWNMWKECPYPHYKLSLLHVKLFLDVYKEIYEICESQGARLLTAALQ